MDISRTASGSPPRAVRASNHEEVPGGLDDLILTSAFNGGALSVAEHNGVQMELMKRVGAASGRQLMTEWIGSHATRFRELIESKEASSWRAPLGVPEQKGQALTLIQGKLLPPPDC